MKNAKALDQFYTKSDIAVQCLSILDNTLNKLGLAESDSIIFVEPSAGAGAFYSNIKSTSKLGLDLDPKLPDIIQHDFLTWDSSQLSAYTHVISVGNPPFGKNSSLALKFLNKCAEFSNVVAFILPRTFKKESMINKINPNFVLDTEWDLPVNSFEFEGAPYDVPCVFQIWVESATPRAVNNSSLSHADFEFCDKDTADFAVRRVGGLAGKVIRDFEGYAKASHYYIKSNIEVEDLISRLESIDWKSVKFNTAGNPSISKRELIALYSKQVEKLRPVPSLSPAKTALYTYIGNSEDFSAESAYSDFVKKD